MSVNNMSVVMLRPQGLRCMGMVRMLVMCTESINHSFFLPDDCNLRLFAYRAASHQDSLVPTPVLYIRSMLRFLFTAYLVMLQQNEHNPSFLSLFLCICPIFLPFPPQSGQIQFE